MNIGKQLSRVLLGAAPRRHVSNVSEKKFTYSFEVGSIRKIHPMRQLSDGTDRLLLTPHLLAITDHGAGKSTQKYSENLDDSYAEKLLRVIRGFFEQETEKYLADPMELVRGAVSAVKLEGSCTLTLAMVHPETGEVSFYYVGDSLYGIFREKDVVMVEPLYERFNEAYKLGDYDASCGYVEKYAFKDIKDELILAASNGLWSNVHLNQLHYEVRGPNSYRSSQNQAETEPKEHKSLHEIAEKVGRLAAHYSKMGNYESPYFRMALKCKVEVAKEGYLDDVTVVLARVKRTVAIK